MGILTAVKSFTFKPQKSWNIPKYYWMLLYNITHFTDFTPLFQAKTMQERHRVADKYRKKKKGREWLYICYT